MEQELHRIRSRELGEAYRLMRKRYGPEAVVISTRQVREGGLFGLLGQKKIELTVSAPAGGREAAPRQKKSAAERRYAANSRLTRKPEMNETVEYFEKLVRDAQARMKAPPEEETPPPAAHRPPPRPVRRDAPAPPAGITGAGGRAETSPVVPFPNQRRDEKQTGESLRREVQEIREMMQVIYAEAGPGAGLPAEFQPHYRALVSRGMARKTAAELLNTVVKGSDLAVMRDPRVFTERLHLELRRNIPVTGGITLHGGCCRVVALCGATGVGKTTNLAKLAAWFSINELARVALLTTDTYRVAASEQLKVYANIIGLPMRVANDGHEVRRVLHEFRDYDLVLIDTAGGSQFNLEQINELKTLLHAAQPHETHLVMSANTGIEDARNVIANFKCLNPAAVLFTKLDETRQYGAMYTMLSEAGLPLSYLSVGQNVPDDIRVATPAMTARLILGENTRG
jgi:flagellar biosynthesis protein FlhF